jgi:3-deoxy-D-manno-octulosonate 8-phosphate phosphatase (KDO 8-P phosphatase)
VTPLTVEDRARRIRLVLLDVDGVLTDGTITIDADGEESKDFNIKDGAAIVWALSAGLSVGLVSARESRATTERARQLGISLVVQGAASKSAALDTILANRSLNPEQVAYMGDDLVDLPVMSRSGLSAAPADAAAETIQAAHWVSRCNGGRGAVRELLELILKAQGRWTAILAEFSG